MNNVDALDGLIGFFIPLFVAFFSKKSFPGWAKGLAMVLISLVIAGIKTAASGQLDVNGEHLAATFFIITASAQISYQALTREFAQHLQTVGPVKDSPPVKQPSFTEINDF